MDKLLRAVSAVSFSLILAWGISPSLAQPPGNGESPQGASTLPAHADISEVALRSSVASLERLLALAPEQKLHPLEPILRWAQANLPRIESIQGYSCVLVKRERIDGRLRPHEYLYLKVRHRPFSVYAYTLAPVKGREIIYVEGRNDGRLWAHEAGPRRRIIGTVSLDPQGPRAMKGQKYPLTEVGILNLTRRLIEVGQQELHCKQIQARTFSQARLNGRGCIVLEFRHPDPQPQHRFHIARVFVDRQYNLPVRYESYGWPQKAGEKPPLLEEYTYLKLQLNPGLTDADFDIRNPKYRFP